VTVVQKSTALKKVSDSSSSSLLVCVQLHIFWVQAYPTWPSSQ
jgi:hypothetical protein